MVSESFNADRLAVPAPTIDPWPLPEPVPSTLSASWCARDWNALTGAQETAGERFCAAVALLQLGRRNEAIEALKRLASEPCAEKWCSAATIELYLLEPKLSKHSRLLDRVEDSVPDGSILQARFWHARGLRALHDLHWEESLRYLVDAEARFRQNGCPAGAAQAADSLAGLYLACGRADLALPTLARALARKRFVDDRVGSAITLGNLGRCALALGHWDQAAEYFQLDADLIGLVGRDRWPLEIWTAYAEIEAGRCESAVGRLEFIWQQSSNEDVNPEPFLAIHLARAYLKLGRREEAAEVMDRPCGNVMPTHTRIWRELVLAMLMRQDDDALRALAEVASEASRNQLADVELKARIAYLERVEHCRGASPEAIRTQFTEAMRRAGEGGLAGELARLGSMAFAQTQPDPITEEGIDFSLAGVEGIDKRFLIRKRLGGGGFATVLLAFDLRRNMDVALKVLDFKSSASPRQVREQIESLRKEISVARALHHPGLVQIFGIGWAGNSRPFLVQEWVDGSTLGSHLPWKNSKRALLELFAGVASTLACLHHAGIIHRDVKPENILIRNADQTPVLIDLGIAAIRPSNQDLHQGYGSPGYAPPEQLAAKSVSASADAFSFGVTLAEATRCHAAPRSTGRGGFIGRLLERKPDMPSSLEELVAMLIEPDPKRRLADMNIVREALLKLSSQE